MIDIRELSFTYPSGVMALNKVSLSVGQGESLGLVGPNGAGKSTLVAHLNGVISPSSGNLRIDGVLVENKNLEEIRRKVGVVFQDPDDMLFMPRIIDDVLFGPLNLGVPKEKAAMEAERVLREAGLWEMHDRAPFTLSQGQKRFAAIAAVLVMSPQVLVLDEPTSDLDPKNRRKLINLLNGFSMTRIVVSHDLDFIWDTCGRTVLLADGKVVADGKTKELLRRRELLEANGLELPLRLQD